jgi:hypothetical protein
MSFTISSPATAIASSANMKAACSLTPASKIAFFDSALFLTCYRNNARSTEGLRVNKSVRGLARIRAYLIDEQIFRY